jgi:hypothetical protein
MAAPRGVVAVAAAAVVGRPKGGGGEDFGVAGEGDVGSSDKPLGVVGGDGDLGIETGGDEDVTPQPQDPLKPNEEKGGETPILISPAPMVGPEITVAGNPAMMSIPIPKSRAEKRDKEAGNPHSSSSSSSSSFFSLSSWTRGRGNACSPTGVCKGLVSGVVVNEAGSVLLLLLFSSLASSLVIVDSPPAQEEDSTSRRATTAAAAAAPTVPGAA